MEYDMKFSGTLTFRAPEDIEEATEEVEEYVADADPEAADRFEDSREEWFMEDGVSLIVAVDTFGSAELGILLDDVMEIYSAYAQSGSVDSWYDDEPHGVFGPDGG